MADGVDVTVKNVFSEQVVNAARGITETLRDNEKELAPGNEDMIPLEGFDHTVIIDAPEGLEMSQCSLRVTAGADLIVTCAVSKRKWFIKMSPNIGDNDVPTTATVEVGEERPG